MQSTIKHTAKATHSGQQTDIWFDDSERNGLYKTIFNRRDVRGQFKPGPVPDEVLSRVLYAAHHAPSVGFMQPWNFLVVADQQKKQQVHDLFTTAHNEAAEMFPEEKRDTYRSLKLEGILESPLNICITCDRDSAGPTVIGRTHIKTMDQYSSVCAVQNLWLAARAEGLGVGWVSILDQRKLQDLLNIPRKIIPIAYLCIGYVDHFYDKPELETAGWLPRQPLEQLVHFDSWQNTRSAEEDSLIEQINRDRDFPEQF
ncbi:5,6-dimethylbenzimidazole synthase [Amphritea balenae]|uniref:5,6-dimethylbenzimidazole synthase n=2 Tax=Amphritea balenae TaxID=452629 RepID=A0A3P1SXC6_9GAMM|nr:5,6-dimethylbenzimidazole synthase [Amphritea balenae]RRD00773.1 5,6-dimethylbenzimidazole synthase [Amphritea balenae]